MTTELEKGVIHYSLASDGNKYYTINGKQSNFKVKEFACKDGSDFLKVDSELIEKLQIMRDYFGRAITINSGYRNEEWNKKVGGAGNSMHLYGKAADIVVSGITPSTVAAFAKKIGFRGVGTYAGFTHVDTRDKTSYWNG